METPTANKSTEGNVRALHSQALGNLQFIRETMEGAGFFTAVPGSAGIVMGAIGIFATGVAAMPGLRPHWLLIWVIASSAAISLGSLMIAYKAVTTGVTVYRGPARRFVLSLAPALVAGVILTLVLVYNDLTALIPGSWLLLYGCGVMAASAVSLPLITTMGACFMVLGTLAFLAPENFANLLLGAGFGGLHLIFGVLLGKYHRG
jgi:hypothetical protein